MKIAYLAPEIPALSATFVYKEILELESMGLEVLPFSVHKPHNPALEKSLDTLKSKTNYVYSANIFTLLKDHLSLLLTSPLDYLNAKWWLLKDICELGLMKRQAFALLFRFFYAAGLASKIRQSGYSHLHIHFAHVPTDIGMYGARMAGITFSVTAHANDLFERGWLLDKKVKRSSFFATISKFNKNFLAQKEISVEKVKIVRCGVDASQFSKIDKTQKSDIFRIGVLGRLVEKKGIDTLIKAVGKVALQESNVELIIAGSGPLDYELKTLASQQGLPQGAIQFVGALANSDVPNFIKSIDTFVLPCKKDSNGDMDGIPVVLMEAMLSGIPVISTKLSGIPELVLDQETGILVEPANVHELAGAILAVKDNGALRDKIVNNAISIVKEEFSILANTRYLHQLFCSVNNIAKDNK